MHWDQGFRSLTNFDIITIMLQSDGISFVEVRDVFNILAMEYPEMLHHLGPESSLVVACTFEMGTMGNLKGMPLSLEQQQYIYI